MEPNISSPLQQIPTIDTNFVKSTLLPSLIILAVILVGGASGWYLYQNRGSSSVGVQNTDGYSTAPGAEVSGGGKEVGSNQENFKDQAEGILKDGGIEGEGTHHLERPGGVSQNVYLTSSVVDLDQFIDKKVQVFGETFAGKKAGWLMDVGRVKILE